MIVALTGDHVSGELLGRLVGGGRSPHLAGGAAALRLLGALPALPVPVPVPLVVQHYGTYTICGRAKPLFEGRGW